MIDLTKRWQVVEGNGLDYLDFALGNGAALIFDPPYGISHSTNRGASWAGTEIANDHDASLRDSMISMANEHDAPWACFGSWKQTAPAGTRGALVWDKGPACGMGDLSFPWKVSWETIYVGGSGWIGSRDEGVIRGHIMITWESKGRKHPHEKPVTILQYLIGKLPEERGLIIDPCAGSGSCGEACMRVGRRFIGIEIDPGYAAIARQRIATAAETLWTPPETVLPVPQLFQ